MKSEKLHEFYSYFNELVHLLFDTEEYIAIDELNFNAYSIKYNWLLQSICSEVDVVVKEVAAYIGDIPHRPNMNDCRKLIVNKYSSICRIKVKFSTLNECIVPWESWKIGESPEWWIIYNNVKHHRVEIDEDSQMPYYKLANQKNVLYALAGLYVLEWYLLHEYTFSEDEKKELMKHYSDRDEASVVKKAKGQIGLSLDVPQIQVIDFRGLKTFFMGYQHFNYDGMSKVLSGDIE